MARLQKLWRLAPVRAELQKKLAAALEISPVVAQILINRGIADEPAAKRFLFAGMEELGDPFQLKDVRKAVERIAAAMARQEKITVYGDYDVDGISASALLYQVLRRLGANVEYYIPERQSEGYGLNEGALEHLQQTGTGLVITVDCGISGNAEVRAVAGRLDIIITDHHQPPPELPPAYAVINPKQKDCPYPEKNLAGVGVAFKLCQALWQFFYGQGAILADYFDLVALGTVADIVPLTGENRILVRVGIEQLKSSPNTGLKALLTVCDLRPDQLDAGKIGFVLAPRLNAAGRLQHAAVGVELLITENTTKALELAHNLNEENGKRQTIEKEILQQAESLLSKQDMEQEKVIVLAGENWHPGVIGIVASRLVDKYYRPVVMISSKEGIGKGSCRSIPAFDMVAALEQCRDLLLQFGGHRQAAGLSVEASNIQALHDRLNAIAQQSLSEADYVPVLHIDALLTLPEINNAFIEQLACLAPYGMGNPGPVFACNHLVLAGIRKIGQDGKHLKLQVRTAGTAGEAVAWNMGEAAEGFCLNEKINLAFIPEINEWQGQSNIQLCARDICKTSAPDRDMVGQVYLTVKTAARRQNPTVISNQQIITAVQTLYNTRISEALVEKCLCILAEIGLLQMNLSNGNRAMILCPAPVQKLDLMQSPTFREGVQSFHFEEDVYGL
ncbi:bacterial recj exonuclease [Lucifera butyrica]|uniref:Single-stranded-DNA-specific exonuclease RecJ n=1 Tax=Lucifera butyrica TaxID=1351585 RepID=A0A498R797_9FIRM|nr:single-stranded-DNA-specific exonuclease RecJ [Lucifera butyrica]VBB06043.1 bacterial recj exonuclease [Lucifera butyrica]